jgi:hypothetical protein
MNFFLINPNCDNRSGFVYASGYGPLDSPMPFLNDIYLESKRKFWEINPMLAGLKISETGYKWPDFLNNGNSPPLFFLSRKVVDCLNILGVTFSSITEMPIGIVKTKSKRLHSSPAPHYFAVTVENGIEIDFVKSGVPIDMNGSPVLRPLPKPWPPLKWFVK